MAEEKSGLEIDDWLDDLAEDTSDGPGQAASGELDQSDLDALLGGGTAASGAPPANDNGGELAQSDIDALLGGGGLAAPVSATGGGGEGFAELDQSDIDSLLGGGGGPAVAAASGTSDDFELDQSDLDGLFAGAGEGKQAEEPAGTQGLGAPSKDDLDHLFSDIGGEEPARPETVGFAEVASAESGKAEAAASGEDNFGLPEDGGLDDDEFDFGDLPDIPDENNTVGTTPQGGMGEEDIFATASPAAAAVPDFLAEATMDNGREKRSASGRDEPPFAPPPKAGKKKGLAVAALCLVLLVGGGGYWYLSKNKKGEMPVPVPPPAQEKPVAPPVAPPVIAEPVVPNAPPVASESRWRMTKPNEPLAIELTGTDENNDLLKFEIVTPPKFGRLSGDLPKITYLPNKDFPGEDSFEFRVSDGKLTSAPAKVVVMGPEEVKPAVAEAPKECPPAEQPVVAAKNVHLKTLSTVPLTINWKKIWGGANSEPFDAKVSVEILGGPPLRGSLHRLDRGRHLYEPNRYFGGKEEVRYRFKAGGVYSKAGKVIITVKRNDKPPVLLLRPVADAYKVGETVVLDAGLTRDDSPGGVRYSWEQVAGPPVHLEKFHGEDSAVTFVVPSTFRTEQKTRIVIRVTATDPGGQRASKEIAITPVSKRQSALWGIAE